MSATAMAHSKLAELEERCEYAQEVLGRPPSWLVRWGKTVVFVVLAVFAWLGWIVRYPDVVPARIVLATLSPPVPIVAPVAGNIGRLRVREQQAAAAGDLIVTIDSAANTDAVLRLRDWIRETRNAPSPAQALGRRVAHERLDLGDLQADFAALQTPTMSASSASSCAPPIASAPVCLRSASSTSASWPISSARPKRWSTSSRCLTWTSRARRTCRPSSSCR